MTDQEMLLRKGQLVDDFVKAKTRLQMLRDEARGQAKVLGGIVEFLESGGERGRVLNGMPPSEYLSGNLAKLVVDLQDAIQESSRLKARLAEIGV